MTEQPNSPADLQLARKALTDRGSGEQLMRRVYPKIVEIARVASWNRSQADDIAQVAAIQVLKSLKSYRGEGSLQDWAARITYRTAMKSFKKRASKPIVLMEVMDEDLPERETPERSFSRKQLFGHLMVKLDVIPEKRRIPFVLHQAYGYTVKEVSAMTDTSVNTVKDRLKTAFREFDSLMEKNPELASMMLEELQ